MRSFVLLSVLGLALGSVVKIPDDPDRMKVELYFESNDGDSIHFLNWRINETMYYLYPEGRKLDMHSVDVTDIE